MTRELFKHRVFMLIAAQLSALGTCDRAQVGAVIVRDGRCVTWGYNGAPPGIPHCKENNHGWGDMSETIEHKVSGCRNATHAELNALAFAARQGISTDNGTLYVTLSPCLDCARALVAAGIVRVFYHDAYRVTDGLDLLARGGVLVDCL